jgi:hypothetical protein
MTLLIHWDLQDLKIQCRRVNQEDLVLLGVR